MVGAGQGQGRRILVAEDESLAAHSIEDLLTDLGYTALLAEDGQSALDLAAQQPVDVLVTDLAMPRLGGLDLIRRLRARRPRLPVVVMTGQPGTLGTSIGQDLAAPVAVLHKPFSLDQLTLALREVAPAK